MASLGGGGNFGTKSTLAYRIDSETYVQCTYVVFVKSRSCLVSRSMYYWDLDWYDPYLRIERFHRTMFNAYMYSWKYMYSLYIIRLQIMTSLVGYFNWNKINYTYVHVHVRT